MSPLQYKSGKNEDVFTNNSFSDWKHAAGKRVFYRIMQGALVMF